MTEIIINADQTIEAKWTGKKGRGSLLQTMASGNCKDANKLDLHELWAVALSVKACPFPLGSEAKVYGDCLSLTKNTPEKVWKDGKCPEIELGKLRQLVVLQAGEGCNAPWDTYLRTAVKHKETPTEAKSCS
jgi:hypothetical protein